LTSKRFSRTLASALLAIGGLAASGGVSLTVFASPAGAATKNGALVVNSGPCNLIDGNGEVVSGTSFHGVANQHGANMTCSANVTPSSTGHAVKYRGISCGWNAPNGILYVTANGRETVSASGNAKFVCTNMTPA
jgi:hypothetical protein